MKRILLISEIRKHGEYCGEYACWCTNLAPRVLSYQSLREREGRRENLGTRLAVAQVFLMIGLWLPWILSTNHN